MVDKMNKKIKIFVLILIIAALIFTCYFEVFGLSFEGKESDFYTQVVTGDNILTYKDSCKDLNLSQVSKDHYSLIGKKIKETGQIVKKEEYMDFGKTRTSIQLKVLGLTPNQYILVNYSDTMAFKQGDNITVYGEYYYPAQDTSIQEISNKFLPIIIAGYIEKA
jgi:hypothetical protein